MKRNCPVIVFVDNFWFIDMFCVCAGAGAAASAAQNAAINPKKKKHREKLMLQENGRKDLMAFDALYCAQHTNDFAMKCWNIENREKGNLNICSLYSNVAK